MVSDGGFQLIPLSVPQQVHLTQDEAVLFFCVGLALVGTILKLELLQQISRLIIAGSRLQKGFC